MKPEKKYSGVVIPAVTPLTAEHRLDHNGVENILDLFRRHEASPFIMGTTGEGSSLAFSLKLEFLELAGRLKKEGDILYAGISSNIFLESVTLAKHSFDLGVDVVVATLPSYYALSESSMLRYFEKLADAVKGPLMIYNIPATTHMSIPLEVVDKLSPHENIVGLKDSERSDERLSRSIELWKDRDDFSHLLGWAARSAKAILAGSDGLVPSTGNFDPGIYRKLYDAARKQDVATAMQLQDLSDQLGNLYQQGRSLGESLWALKIVMNELGLCEPVVMPPLYEMEFREAEELRKKFHELNIRKEISDK
jgi:dihydrodipicolinate synthase/N-acetylneuraminate lyase